MCSRASVRIAVTTVASGLSWRHLHLSQQLAQEIALRLVLRLGKDRPDAAEAAGQRIALSLELVALCQNGIEGALLGSFIVHLCSPASLPCLGCCSCM